MAKIRVNKPDAARRQLDQAIVLFFSNADPVPIHTLAMAAFRVLKDLIEHKGLKSQSILGNFDDRVRPEMRKEFWASVHGLSNFL